MAETLQDLHRRRLARPVGAEEGEDLSRADLQVDARYGGHPVVGLLEPTHHYCDRPGTAVVVPGEVDVAETGRCATPLAVTTVPRGHGHRQSFRLIVMPTLRFAPPIANGEGRKSQVQGGVEFPVQTHCG